MEEIDSLRAIIIDKYLHGNAFSELVKEYNMDGNPNGGDLGWFKSGAMVKEFEEAFRDPGVGEIFTVDVPSRKWFYVTLKTHAIREIKKLKLVRINYVN